MREPASENPLDQAVKRLDRAISQLEQRLAGAGGQDRGLFAPDGARLAVELEKAREREKELEEAGAEASAALGRAIAEIKAALAGAPAAPVEQTEEA